LPNKPLSPPPVQIDIINPEETKVTPWWSSWLTDVHNLLSNRTNQAITAATAVSPDAKYVSLTTTASAYAIALEVPTVTNRKLIIEMIAKGGANNVTMSLANVTGGTAATTCTWTAANQQLILESAALKWVVIKQNGVTLT
jgi:hypothetical protein